MPNSGSAVPNRFRNHSELPKTGSTVPRPSGGTGTDGRFLGSVCPGCGSTDVLPGRTFCRPTCKARHQWQRAQRERPLFDEQPLKSEWRRTNESR